MHAVSKYFLCAGILIQWTIISTAMSQWEHRSYKWKAAELNENERQIDFTYGIFERCGEKILGGRVANDFISKKCHDLWIEQSGTDLPPLRTILNHAQLWKQHSTLKRAERIMLQITALISLLLSAVSSCFELISNSAKYWRMLQGTKTHNYVSKGQHWLID